MTFVWRGDARTRAVSIDWPAWTFEFAKSALAPLAGSDLWWKSVRMPHDTRMSYRFVVAPRAAHQAPAQRMELVLPGAKPELFLAPVPVAAAGSLERQVWSSPRLKNDHPLLVYRPLRYSADKPAYPLLILFDGESYLSAIAGPTLLDNLIAAGKIPALVAVFVVNATPRSRSRELPCSAAFADAVASELMPVVACTTADQQRSFTRGRRGRELRRTRCGVRGVSASGTVRLGAQSIGFVLVELPKRFAASRRLLWRRARLVDATFQRARPACRFIFT